MEFLAELVSIYQCLMNFCWFVHFVFISGIQRRTVSTQDILGMEKTPPDTEILQHKASEALGIGNDLEA